MYRYFIFAIFFFSCDHPGKKDIAAEEKAIRALLQQERKAHFDRNADLFVSEFADSMVSVNKGKVSILSPERNKERIKPYFESVNFIKWDNVAEPVIRFSDDGKMAYAIVQKEVVVTYPDSTGRHLTDTTHYAWVSIYRKKNGEWKVEANISTNK